MDPENLEEHRKKYKPLENVLQTINSKYIALSEQAVKKNNNILQQNIMNPSVQCLKNHVLPGYVNVRIENYDNILKRPEAERKGFEDIRRFLDHDNFLSTEKVLTWMESVVSSSMDKFFKLNGKHYMELTGQDDKVLVYMTMVKGSPAFTLELAIGDPNSEKICVDLVPSFQFEKKDWPVGYRPNNSRKFDKFLVVPKKPKKYEGLFDVNRYWRLSFQEQERDMISGIHLRSMKPSLKLLKKLRDKQKHDCIASYFIKTIYLWTLEKKPEKFWSLPLGAVFMLMLKEYADCVQKKYIPYFWNENLNLIGHVNDIHLKGLGNRLKNIIDDIERGLAASDVFVVGNYLLNPEDIELLKKEVTLSKKLVSTVSCTDATDSSVPLIKLGYPKSDVEKTKEDIAFLERSKEERDQVMAQLYQNSDILVRVETKLDDLITKVNQVCEDNKEIKKRLSVLEEKIENSQTKGEGVNNLNSIDALLSIRNIENTGPARDYNLLH
ncbi:uncharacterized protein LOC115877880 isoform X3 [Sitophilus oryzae]|uniref:Uncharacterized protein LOC115877880 isoform X3 n=1 Tax=Sitophilus oryzae TaxID=7048 RepID=A0A6J2XHA3_SITOR|nr:uncharacterized protein LOC115877880 isoform X3 [Sitophilus oryzae]